MSTLTSTAEELAEASGHVLRGHRSLHYLEHARATVEVEPSLALGAIVVEIDPERRQLEVDNMSAVAVQAEAQLKEARRELDRVEKLAGHGAASEVRVDEVHTRVDMARSGLVAAQAQAGLAGRALADASVTAPFAGLIARRRVSAGEYVNEGQELFDLVADPLEVNNLYGTAEVVELTAELLGELDRLQTEVGDAPFPLLSE